MYDHIVSAGSLKNLEVRLAQALDHAMQAETDLNRTRLKAGLEAIPKAFFLPSEHAVAVREACALAVEEAADAKTKHRMTGWPYDRLEREERERARAQAEARAAVPVPVGYVAPANRWQRRGRRGRR